jgi:uncharacterized membrane protein
MLLIHILQENNPIILSPAASGAEEIVSTSVLWLILLIEFVAAILIGIGVLLTLTRLVNVLFRLKGEGYEKARLTLARFLALALEFQLAADVLGTAVAPSWTQIGKLGAIAVIRTALNYFLAREIKEEENATDNVRDIGARTQS